MAKNITAPSVGWGAPIPPVTSYTGNGGTYTLPNLGNGYINSSSVWVTSATNNIVEHPNSGKIKLTGTNADIDMNGMSLKETLKGIQERLNILTVNAELESEWDELRELGEQYRALEKQILDKLETWKRLNKQEAESRK